MVIGSRDDAERALARALSRHIGYTSGAYDLKRIFSVLDIFHDRTSVYRDELVALLGQGVPEDSPDALSIEYRSDILSFATSMGLVEIVSAREAKLARFAATELGRSFLGARALDDPKFTGFYAAQVVLRADADFIVPILAFSRGGARAALQTSFVEFQKRLREVRLEWLLANFKEPILFERVASHIPWLRRKKASGALYEAEIPTLNTARHHATPRLGWLEQLGLLNRKDQSLTSFGHDVVNALDIDTYFWLAPPEEALRTLRLDAPPPGQPEDALNFAGHTAPPSEGQAIALVADVAEIMTRGFSAGKLVHASQASLLLPIEYIRYRSYVDGVEYNWSSILELLFSTYRGVFDRYSAHTGKIGFYRVVNQ
jgi:hypothetical protein